MQSLVGIVDFLIVSRLGGEAVAAVGVASQIFFLQIALYQAINVGTVAMVARAIGGGDSPEADRVLRGSLLLGVVAGLLVSCLIPVTVPIVSLFGVAPGVANLASGYLDVAFAFALPLSLGTVFFNGQRGAGDVLTPLKIGLVVNLVNVVCDYALVFGELGAPRLGVVGAAYASGIAMTVGLLVVAWLYLSGRLVLERRGWLQGVDRDLLRRLVRLGLPSCLEATVFNFGILAFTAFMARFGTAAVGAYFIGIRILSMSFVPGIAFSVAASTLVGQHLGAEEPDEAARAGFRALRGAIGVMAVVGASIALFAESLTAWFGGSGAQTVSLAVRFIWILALAQPLMAVEFAIGGALRGAGDTRFPLFAVLSGLFGGRLLLATLVSFVFDGGVVAVWLCLLSDYAIKAALLLWRFVGGAWRHVEV
jgi:putative MATE family efflux protein